MTNRVYNYRCYKYDLQNGSQLPQEPDGLYYNATIGLQFYFGNRNNSKTKVSKKENIEKGVTEKEQSVIESNWIGEIK